MHLEKLKNYRPSEKEPFMNERQRDYFRAKLLAWKDEILRESKVTLQTLQEENVNLPDLADRASSETDRAVELRAQGRIADDAALPHSLRAGEDHAVAAAVARVGDQRVEVLDF